jgi:ribonuclease VapC
MVIDTSAVVAILRLEPDAGRFLHAVTASDVRVMSAANLIEASLVLAGRRGNADDWQDLDEFLRRADVDIIPLDLEHVRVARDAFLRFGKGRHPAALNFGDCAAYALAKSRDLPLLFKGGDFSKTDITPAVASSG